MTMATLARPSAPPSNNGAEPQGKVVPFIRAAGKGYLESESKTILLGTAVQTTDISIPATGGWLRRVDLMCELISTGNAATVTAAADGPFSAIAQAALKDPQQVLLHNMTGYESYILDTWGGFHLFPLDGSAASFAATTTGAGATAGSGKFLLPINSEFGREALGVLAIQDSGARYTLTLSVGSLAQIYGATPPNGAVNLKITPTIVHYMKPNPIDARQRAAQPRPTWDGTLRYTRTLQQSVDVGEFTRIFTMSGRFLRNVILLWRDAATDARSDTVMPDKLTVEYDNQQLQVISEVARDAEVFRVFGKDPPTGVFPLVLGTTDPDGNQGGEWGDFYLPTTPASQIVVRGTAGAAGKLLMMLDEVVPVGDILRY